MRGCAIVVQIVAASICQEHRWKMTGSTMNMKLAAICSGGHHSRPAVGPSAGAPPPVVMHGRRRGVARQANAAGSTAPGLRGPGGICLHLVGLAGPPVLKDPENVVHFLSHTPLLKSLPNDESKH